MNDTELYKPWRGITTKGELVYGQLINTQGYIKYKPKQHTKTWLVRHVFGNGGWFNIRSRVYVRPASLQRFTGYFINKEPIYVGDTLIFGPNKFKVVETKNFYGATNFGIKTHVKIIPLKTVINRIDRDFPVRLEGAS